MNGPAGDAPVSLLPQSTERLRKGIRANGLDSVGFAGRCVREDARRQEHKDAAVGQVRNAVRGHRKQLATIFLPSLCPASTRGWPV